MVYTYENNTRVRSHCQKRADASTCREEPAHASANWHTTCYSTVVALLYETEGKKNCCHMWSTVMLVSSLTNQPTQKKMVSLVVKWSSGPSCVLNWETQREKNDECWVINHRFALEIHVLCTWGFPHTKSGLQLQIQTTWLPVVATKLLAPNKTPNSRSRTCICSWIWIWIWVGACTPPHGQMNLLLLLLLLHSPEMIWLQDQEGGNHTTTWSSKEQFFPIKTKKKVDER